MDNQMLVGLMPDNTYTEQCLTCWQRISKNTSYAIATLIKTGTIDAYNGKQIPTDDSPQTDIDAHRAKMRDIACEIHKIFQTNKDLTFGDCMAILEIIKYDLYAMQNEE
jgi:hypothetical protein